MKKINQYLVGALLCGMFVTACKPDIADETRTAGDLNLTKYVAIGNSITAGYSNGGVYRDGQLVAYPNLIADQMKKVGGGNFPQPLFDESQSNGSGYVKLTGFNALGLPVLTPVTDKLGVRGRGKDGKTLLYTKFSGANNNLGIPGIRISDIATPGYGLDNPLGCNPYFERLLPDNSLKTYMDFVKETNPTFFTCWLGNNDALGYATSGGLVPLTPDAAFTALYTTMINNLTAGGAKGAVATIPNVTALPFFSVFTVKVVRASAGNADLYIRTASGVRKATDSDLISLQADSIGTKNALGIPKGFHPLYPMNTEDILDSDEVAKVTAQIASYNNIIKGIASSKGLAVADASAVMDELKSKGKMYNGLTVNSAYISGGVFSLDGVHLTPRGNAIAANEFIKAINATYKSNIPLVDVMAYGGVSLGQ
jgi:GDSL-like Lipase/Acylhydrolase